MRAAWLLVVLCLAGCLEPGGDEGLRMRAFVSAELLDDEADRRPPFAQRPINLGSCPEEEALEPLQPLLLEASRQGSATTALGEPDWEVLQGALATCYQMQHGGSDPNGHVDWVASEGRFYHVFFSIA